MYLNIVLYLVLVNATGENTFPMVYAWPHMLTSYLQTLLMTFPFAWLQVLIFHAKGKYSWKQWIYHCTVELSNTWHNYSYFYLISNTFVAQYSSLFMLIGCQILSYVLKEKHPYCIRWNATSSDRFSASQLRSFHTSISA